MSPEREPMENDSNSRTAEELEQQTVDVYVERALHGPVFRMSYEHTHTYCEIFYLKSGTCTYTVNQGQWHLEAGDLFIVAAGDPHSTRYEGKTSCERIIVFCKSDVLAGMMRGDPTEVQQALERSCKVILNAETRTMAEALLDQMLLENDLPRKYSEQVLELESLHLVLLLLRNGIFSHETMSPKEGYSADIERAEIHCAELPAALNAGGSGRVLQPEPHLFFPQVQADHRADVQRTCELHPAAPGHPDAVDDR